MYYILIIYTSRYRDIESCINYFIDIDVLFSLDLAHFPPPPPRSLELFTLSCLAEDAPAAKDCGMFRMTNFFAHFDTTNQVYFRLFVGYSEVYALHSFKHVISHDFSCLVLNPRTGRGQHLLLHTQNLASLGIFGVIPSP